MCGLEDNKLPALKCYLNIYRKDVYNTIMEKKWVVKGVFWSLNIILLFIASEPSWYYVVLSCSLGYTLLAGSWY